MNTTVVSEKRYLRNYFLINKIMKLRFISKLLVLAIIAAVLYGLLIWITIWPIFSDYVPTTLQKVVLGQLLMRVGGASVVIIGLMIVVGLMVMHQIAGPLYHLEQGLDQFIQGKPIEPIHLRKKDEFQELAAKINTLLACRHTACVEEQAPPNS